MSSSRPERAMAGLRKQALQRSFKPDPPMTGGESLIQNPNPNETRHPELFIDWPSREIFRADFSGAPEGGFQRRCSIDPTIPPELMKHLPYHSLMLALGIAFTASATAQMISFNVDNNSTVGGDGAGSLPASPALAGASGALADYWTNVFPAYDFTDLRDSTGVETTLDVVSPRPFGTYPQQFSHPGVDTDGSWNKEMLNGYANGGYVGNNPATITLNQIPYTSYDVYVYFASDDATRTGTVTDGTTTYPIASS